MPNLSQTETGNLQAKTAVTQGDDLKMLTKMTVHGFRHSEVPVGCILWGIGADVIVKLHHCLTTELSEKVERV
ncbi:uncharacterized protein J4E87_005207 [Alternaria ethzedia]|uniref:uncharacterized protein n=1 Tax=Alternaria ethzedia TaxID=181014 RepID=UPI0020C2D89E|nr:uncharacterized protein J4E87_005207 [Alternaria ethzedia]KAI4625360.1 hypothetical protein J4E87_005207 [Alternaria ethzedia]